jgi:ubiquinone/menaquinone biosynthesis C-methylase UbiE
MKTDNQLRVNSKKGKDWHEEDAPWKAQKVYQILQKNQINPSSIGEIGCGSGELLLSLSKYYDNDVRLSGYVTSDEAYNKCKNKEIDNLHYYFKNLLKEDVYFDLVMAINVFTHVNDYLGFLSQLKSKGKYKVFHIPLELTVYSILRSSYYQKKIKEGSYRHLFNKDTALGTLIGTGYEIIDYFYTSGALELPNRGPKENLWKLPRKLLFGINEDFGAKLLGGFQLMVLTK